MAVRTSVRGFKGTVILQIKVRNSADVAGASGLLLRDLIDYAGLFPPASLSMALSVQNYHAYSLSEWDWVLGRLIVPVARLAEFELFFAQLPVATVVKDSRKWRLSVLPGTDVAADVDGIRRCNDRLAGKAVIESVELKVTSAEEIGRLSAIIPAGFATYFEFPLSNCGACVAAVADCGRRAKIRTGGESADKFPTAKNVIEFIRSCAAAGVAFKATAGLHHPLRSMHRLTYQPQSPSGMMHGFLNVFLAAGFLRAGMELELATQLLEEQSWQAFQFDWDGVNWREHRLGRNEIASEREIFAVSFGSCSFTEPIEDLQSLNLL